ncbi:MAG TPA: hypothetical protein VN661_10615 [Candidatus Acidoferrales bacterium]|nr:hypothetical protein [Candidatus Acidoferrales bacterium]
MDLSRREFTKLVAGAGAGMAAGFPAHAEAAGRTIAIQVGAVSFVDEGVDQVLDIFQRDAAINTLCVATFSYGRGIAGRQIPGQPLPDHGSRQYDTNFHGGNYATTHEQYYERTPLKKIQSPDHPGFDVLEAVLPRAKARGMKTYCWYEDVFRRDLEGIEQLEEVTLSGRRATDLCFHNPGVQAFWQALTEDYVRSYPVDGIMWCSERQGPLGNALGASHGGARDNPFEVTCFCEFCRRAAQARGLDADRAAEGYTKLANLVRDSRAGTRPSDGYFVSYWRLLVDYPEILGWEKLWNDGQKTAYANIRAMVKSLRPDLPVGWHIWHNNSFSPFYRAEQDYADFAKYSDFLKVVMYNNCGGPRLASYINSVSRTIFADFSPEEALELTYKIMNYNEASLGDLPRRGLSSNYVERETRRAVEGVKRAVKIWPGIDIDVPTGRDQKKTEPQDVRDAVRAAFRGGADGVILSRKYSEMRLANLRAVKEALT